MSDVEIRGANSRSGGVREYMHEAKRRLYPNGRPGALAGALNRMQATVHAIGIWPSRLMTMEVPGRRTGRTVSFPVVAADYGGDRYFVAMLGEHSNWVRNVRAANGRVVLRHGRREQVRLVEVEVGARAPILRRYLECAPGARPHIPVDVHAPLAEFEQIAPQFPVFRVADDDEVL